MGELAALGTSLAWSFSSIQFTLAGRRVGSLVVNRIRLILAVLYLSAAHLAVHGRLWPLEAGLARWGWLGLSGIVGLTLGDACLFQAFVLIGPRRAMLIMTLVPVLSTLIAWAAFGELLLPVELAAMLVTIGGIAWVVSERRSAKESGPATQGQSFLVGVLFGVGGAVGQAVGYILSKQGLAGGFPPLSATVIRMVVAAVAIWLITLAQGRVKSTWPALKDRVAVLLMMGGALAGPFIGVWLSMVAVQNAPMGIASTLTGLSPILLIPLEHWVFHEAITPRSVIGTLVALVGAAIIFLT